MGWFTRKPNSDIPADPVWPDELEDDDATGEAGADLEEQIDGYARSYTSGHAYNSPAGHLELLQEILDSIDAELENDNLEGVEQARQYESPQLTKLAHADQQEVSAGLRAAFGDVASFLDELAETYAGVADEATQETRVYLAKMLEHAIHQARKIDGADAVDLMLQYEPELMMGYTPAVRREIRETIAEAAGYELEPEAIIEMPPSFDAPDAKPSFEATEVETVSEPPSVPEAPAAKPARAPKPVRATPAARPAPTGTPGDAAVAIRALTRAIAANPHEATAFKNRGLMRARHARSPKDYMDAILDYNQALKLDAADVSIYEARGYAYYRLGNKPRARADFIRAAQAGADYQFGDPVKEIIQTEGWRRQIGR